MLVPIVLIIFYFIIGSSSQLSCKDENNNNIDWFIALKYPKSYDFVYLTENNNQWRQSSKNLSSEENMIGLTISQSYNKQFFSAYYNDEPIYPSLYESERGHLKGVLNFGQSDGYWLIHSVPKFPTKDTYEYHQGQEIYAQSFICVTVGVDNLPSIVRQLLIMQSTVYSFNLPDHFSSNVQLMTDLKMFVANKNDQTTVDKILPFKTLQNLQLVHFGKSRLFNDDLYSALIAPSLKASLYVESWIRGERVPSSCGGNYDVYNVEKVNLINKQFNEHADHSKWAISISGSNPYVCIGDINRMTSQFSRGGGSLCVYNQIIWQSFSTVVASYEKCK